MYKKLRFLTTMLLLAVCCGTWAEGKFVKISSTSDLTDGNYLIVYEASTQTYVFNGALEALDAVSNFVNVVYKSQNDEISGSDFENSYVTITNTGTAYTIKSKSGYYIGHTGSKNTLNTSTTEAYENTITFNNTGNAVISCGNYSLKFNSTNGQMRFRYFTSGQQAISLYKYVDNSTPTCATPVFSPAAGTYTSAKDVTISTETDGATIYYTTDGNDPTTESSVYSSAIKVSSTTTIKAIAVKDGESSAVAEATYTIVNIEHAGTVADPYTVADARAAIDANTGKTGVYATGIVSEIVTAYNSQYGNITFNFVDKEGDTKFLQAYRCEGNEAANVQVGDIVVVHGNLTKYGSTYEFGQGCQLVSLTHPSIPVISADNVELAYDAISGEIAYTITNTSENVSLKATTDADWISNITVGETSVTFTTTANEGNEDRTATFTLSYEGATDKPVTVTQKHFVADYATLPFEFDGGSSAIANTAGLTQEGLGSDYNSSPKLKFDSTGDYVILKINDRPGVLTFDIKGNSFSGGTFTVQTSEDGETYTNLKAYTEISGTQNETFNNLGENVRYIKWIYTNKSNGNVAFGNIKLEKYSDVVVPEEGDNYELFSGELVEGDYLIVYEGKAMNTAVESERLQYAEVTTINDVITTDDATIVWHIAKSGDYWTIYNADADAYAASTGAKSKAQMLADGTDDKALWTVSGTETYEFVNKQNTANNVNANLRNNGTYGFACYATGTGGALSLYKKETSQTVTVSSAGYATYVAADNVSFPDAVTAYIVSEVTASSIKLTKVTAVEKDVPVVVKAAAGTYDLEVVTAAVCNNVTGNLLLVSDGNVKDNILVLANKNNGVGFYSWAGDYLPAGKVYLENTNSSREFFGFDEGVATSISTIDNGQLTMENAYNLQGQKVGSEYKGIVIVNGKKFINK